MTGMCRLCASLKHGLVTVTEQSGGLAHKLFLCCRLHLEMEKEGPLPKAVCKECIENLNVSYKFLTEVQEAQEKLHAFFGTPFDKGLHIDDNSDNTQSFTISSVSSLPRTTTTGTTNEVLREYILPENVGVKQELPYDDAQLADAQMEAMTSSLMDDDQNRMITDELSLILNRTSGSGGPQKVIQKTGHNTLKCRCNELTHKLDEIKGQMDILIEANVEHKNILSKHLRQHNETLEIRSHFPIKSEEKLREMDERINNENKQDYVKAVRAIIHPAGVCKNLKYIISTEIIMGYNLEGVHGKKSLKRLVNFYSVILESIPNAAKNAGPAEEQLRKAIQLLKKREFKAISTAKTRKSSNEIRDIRLNFLGKAKKDVSSTLTDESSTFE